MIKIEKMLKPWYVFNCSKKESGKESSIISPCITMF